jgi:hypothetical protein
MKFIEIDKFIKKLGLKPRPQRPLSAPLVGRLYSGSQLDAIQHYIVVCRGIGTAVPLRVCGLKR